MSSKPTWETQQDPVLGLMMNVAKLLEASMPLSKSLSYSFHMDELRHVFSALEAAVFPFVRRKLIKPLVQRLVVRTVLMQMWTQVFCTSVLAVDTSICLSCLI